MDTPEAEHTDAVAEKKPTKAETLDKLFHETFASSPLATNTEHYNMVHDFKEKVKALFSAA